MTNEKDITVKTEPAETIVTKEEKDVFVPTPEQQLALDHEGSDLLISAGAGSGKTATLTDRIVNRIHDQNKDISRMLVVTYTKDAANELKSRITKKLGEKLKEEPNNAHLGSQITKISSADISTIHSFCLKVMRPHFDELNLDSDFRIGEESELFVIRQEAMNEVIDDFYEAETIDPDFLLVCDCYSEYTNEDTLGESLLSLYKTLISTSKGLNILLEPPQESEEFLATKYGNVLVKKIRICVDRFLPVVSDLYNEIVSNDCNKKYAKAFTELYDILTRLQNALTSPKYSVIKGIFDDYQAIGFSGGRTTAVPSVDVEFLTVIRDEVQDELKELKNEYFYADENAICSSVRQNKKICYALYKVLSAFDNTFKVKKRKYGLCDFNDLERYTFQLFYDKEGNVTPLAKTIGLQYDELYIDEYQDVNSIQDKIFSAISRNNRFMVGDIKQSIYSFRAAEPDLFSGYRDSFKEYTKSANKAEGKCLFMSDNFRCDQSVIDFTNHVSDYMFLQSKGFNYVTNDRLKHSKKHKGVFNPQNVSLCIINKSALDKESVYKTTDLDPQAEFVAQEIKKLIDSGKLPNGKKIEPKHIAILLRSSKGCIDKYIEALSRYGIKNEYIQDVSFFEKPHILLMMCLLNAIDNPSKDVYFAGALRSPIWDFSLEEMVKIKKFSPSEYSLYSAFENYGGDKKIREKIDSLFEKISLYRSSIRKMTADEAISYIMTETGYLSSCSKEQREDIIKLYNMARTYEKNSYKGLYSFLRYIEDSASKKDLTETVSNDPDNCVKIVTMHKSKGLEYEVCFLCDTDKRFSKKGYSAPILFHKDLGICGYVSRDNGIVKYDNLLRKCASLAIKNSEKEEALRVLYVAMTRARSKLYVTANITKPQEAQKKHRMVSHLKDEFSIYSKNSHIEYIMGACPFPLDFVDEQFIDPNTVIPKENIFSENTECNEDTVKAYESTLKERLKFEYKYNYLKDIPSKLSVSTLRPELLDENENEEFDPQKHNVELTPKFLETSKHKATGAERGTATHLFLQFCDFKNLKEKGFKYELNRLIENSFISKEIGSIIYEEHIETFINKMLDELLDAKQVIREFRFNVLLDAKNFTKENKSLFDGEKVLVQGVTDCIYENKDGELILLDYKTDAVTEENYETLLKERHSTQLTYYKEACNMMFGRKISKVFVYSVPLGKTVEIKQ